MAGGVGKNKGTWKHDEIAAMQHDPDVAAFVKSGRLHSTVSHRILVLSTLIFAIVIGAPALYQAWTERHSAEGIEATYLLRDMLQTPQERANDLRQQADSLSVMMAQGNWTDSGAMAWDGLAQGFVQLWQRARIANRYIELDSLGKRIKPFTSLRNKAMRLSVLAGNSEPLSADSIFRLKTDLQSLAHSFEMRAGPLANVQRFGNALVFETLLASEYLRAWEAKSEVDSRVAQTTRPWLQMLRYQWFNDLGIKGVMGEDGWSFYRPGIEYAVRPWVTDPVYRPKDANDLPKGDDPLQAIVEFRDQLRTFGVELIVMPVPNKETVYPDRLDAGISSALAGKVGHGEMIVDSLRSRGVLVVDLYHAFAAERKNDQSINDALYLQNDTHWRLRALHLAALEVRNLLVQQPWFGARRDSIAYVRKSCMVTREGDITAMSKLPAATFLNFRLHFSPQVVDCEQVYSVTGDSNGAVVDSTLYKDDFRHARILILGDSFSRIYQTDAPRGAGWIAHLADALGEPIASLVSDGGASTLVREKLARKPAVLRGKTVVIWEFVERDYRFGDEGWKRVEFTPTSK